jgi:hypothetical protein
MRRLATWLVVGLLGALGAAAAITAVVTDNNGSSAVPMDTHRSTTVSLPGCRHGQLGLSIEMASGSPALVLRHVSGPACDVGKLEIRTAIRDQRGERVPVHDTRSAFAGEISLGVGFIDTFAYLPRCDQKGPLVATATAGELGATHTLPVRLCLDLDTEERRAVIRFDETLGAAWQDLVEVERGSRSLTARIDLPHGVPIEIWLEREPPGVARINLLYPPNPRRHRKCRINDNRDVCVIRRGLRERDSGMWKVVARKLSRDSAVVRLSVTFGEAAPGE